jgi:hypothetical protein
MVLDRMVAGINFLISSAWDFLAYRCERVSIISGTGVAMCTTVVVVQCKGR